VIESNGAVSNPVTVNVEPAAPGIFLIGGTRAAALNQDYSLNMPENPAATGSVVSIYFSGQGQVDHSVQTGAAAPDTFPINTLAPTSATVGGQPANVLFCGLAPGFVGLAQVNVQIPDIDPGEYSVRLTMGLFTTSNAGTISVSRAPQ
jgi:adhesin/invasin